MGRYTVQNVETEDHLTPISANVMASISVENRVISVTILRVSQLVIDCWGLDAGEFAKAVFADRRKQFCFYDQGHFQNHISY